MPVRKEQDAMTAALRLLTGRSYSQAELERSLRQRRFPAAAVSEAIDTCRRCGYLDDVRAARERITTMVRRGYGPHRIRRALEQMGLEGEQVVLLLSEHLPLEEEMRLARWLLEKRGARGASGEALRSRKAREYRFLLQRGFSIDAALRATESDTEWQPSVGTP